MNSSAISDTNSILVEPIQPCPACGTPVNVAAFEPLDVYSCPECGAECTVQARVGRYALISRLGRGGTGVAFKAFDADLKRHVALKLLNREAGQDPTVVAELEKEALIMGSLKDVNIVQIFTAGRHGDRIFLVMELVEGGSLEERITDWGKIPEAAVVELAIQVASGLEAARRAGLVHRDVKPGNILFTREGIAKVADFGLSMLAGEAAGAATELKGTAFYIPPERVKGRGEDFRGDIYSLGATLFHALTGRPVFDAATAGEIAMKHVSTPAPSVQAIAPGVTALTARVLARMLHKAPRDRQGSHEELIAEWQAVKSQLSSTQRQVQPTALASSMRPAHTAVMKRLKWGTGVWILGIIAGVIFVGVAIWLFGGRGKVPAGRSAAELAMAASSSPSAQREPVLSIDEIRKRNAETAAAEVAAAKWRPIMVLEDDFPPYARPSLGTGVNWVTRAEGPVSSGTRSLRISSKPLAQGIYQGGAEPMEVSPTARFSLNMYVDPSDPPRMVMIQAHTDQWRHRGIWGDPNAMQYGRPNTGERFVVGPLPEKGRWVTVEVFAKDMDLKPGQLITGMSVTLVGGTAYFDALKMIPGQ